MALRGNKGEECFVLDEFYLPDPRASNPTKKDQSDAETKSTEKNDQQQKSSKKKQKNRGQNKNRPGPMKFQRSERICPILVDITSQEPWPECEYQNCQFLHDTKKFWEEKREKDISKECHNFKTFGRCRRGITCRFASGHVEVTTDKVFNVENSELFGNFKEVKRETNHLERELRDQLRKNTFDFKYCDKIVDEIFKQREIQLKKEEEKLKSEKGDGNDNSESSSIDTATDSKVETSAEPTAKKLKIENESVTADNESSNTENSPSNVENGSLKSGNGDLAVKVVVESGIEINEPEKKKINWNDKLYLAPLTTVGNLPFRRICKKFGADITCGEMAMGLPILQGHLPEWALVQRHESEDVFGIQLCGCSPNQMTRVAKLVEDHIDCDFVDLNLGCPIDLVYKRGMGSGLMSRKKPLEVMIRAMSKVLSVPITVKMRTGIYMDKRIAHNLIPAVREWGADMVTLHGRSREQRYYRLADWDYIAECAKVASPMPLYGNGDLINFEDYNALKEKSKVNGVMIARGALIKPWVFKEIKEQKHWDITAQERLEMIQDYANYGMEHWGSDDRGVETTRRFLLEWLSFLHRYVPHGILAAPPQRMNQRIPTYKGRDEMETLLCSPDVKDWVKITEMFLGKVPEQFSFEPKHRAHSTK